jgi:hypothetical protein
MKAKAYVWQMVPVLRYGAMRLLRTNGKKGELMIPLPYNSVRTNGIRVGVDYSSIL